MSQPYGIKDLAESQAYLADQVLRQRLKKVIELISKQLLQHGQRLSELMGGRPDAVMKVSSFALFSATGIVSAQGLLDQLGRSCRGKRKRLTR
jgi:uncharacterized protein (DUF1810 family)